ncbi:hypothetical protein [Alkalihalobacterium elongatum]|uniref:hypothetical protein n=1 Tax=Alkalihalobacterium elongatum TaxID=2675466 RepID=UPI001C1FDC6D|nr:hypothetical protein [Alkalihalobacterium elongatum]
MKKKTLTIQPAFYLDSPYAKYIEDEEHDDSYGLIYYEFLHEMGTLLGVDIIFNQLTETNWLITDDHHMKITYYKDGQNNEMLEFEPKTIEGKQSIQKMADKLLLDNSMYITFN